MSSKQNSINYDQRKIQKQILKRIKTQKQKQLNNKFKINGDHNKDKSIMKLFSTLLNGIKKKKTLQEIF